MTVSSGKGPPGGDIRRILIIQTAFLGDLVLTLPLIDASGRVWPDAAIDVLARAPYASFLALHPRVQRVIPFDKRGADRGLSALFAGARRLRARDYQLALIPHRSLRSALLAALAGIPRRVGFSRTAGSPLHTDRVPRRLDVHESARNLALLEPFRSQEDGAPETRPRFEIRATPAADEFARWRDSVGLPDGRRMIALAPGSVWETKRWPEAHWAELLARINTDRSLLAVFVGGPEDRELCLRARDASGAEAFIAAGELSVGGSAALIDAAGLLITGDTAPLHLAQMVDTPTLAIFGPTVPEFGFAPTGENDRVIGLDLPCRPCAIHGGSECPLGHHHCMRRLSADYAWNAAARMLSP